MKEGRDNFLLENDDGELYGVCLGCDFTAEHEWGIEKLRSLFGINLKAEPGIARRKVTKIPTEDFRIASGALVCLPMMRSLENPKKPCSEFRKQFEDEEIRTAWDEGTFAIVPFTDRAKAFLVELYDAFKRLDAAMWIGSSSGFSLKTAGLTICIASKVPATGAAAMEEADRSGDALRETAEKTGIEKRLKKADRQLFRKKSP